MHVIDLFLVLLGNYCNLLTYSHGLWPLCCHLQELPTTWFSWTGQEANFWSWMPGLVGLSIPFLTSPWLSVCLSVAPVKLITIIVIFSLHWKLSVLIPTWRCPCGCQFRNGYLSNLCSLVWVFDIILFTLRNHSAEGKHKALSTCRSHITVVTLSFGPLIFTYLRTPTTFPEDKVFSLLYHNFSYVQSYNLYCEKYKDEKCHEKSFMSKDIFRRET